MGTSRSPLQGIFNGKMNIAIFAAFFLIFFGGIPPAESAETVQDLMKEPATMFDLGIVCLENLLRHDQRGRLDVVYDLERNKIQINIVIISRMSKAEKKRSRDDLRRLVQQAIQRARMDLNVNPVTGEIDPGYTTLEDCFRHAVYNKKNDHSALKDELYNMTEISAKVIVHRDEAAVEAKVPLVGNRIDWVK